MLAAAAAGLEMRGKSATPPRGKAPADGPTPAAASSLAAGGLGAPMNPAQLLELFHKAAALNGLTVDAVLQSMASPPLTPASVASSSAGRSTAKKAAAAARPAAAAAPPAAAAAPLAAAASPEVRAPPAPAEKFRRLRECLIDEQVLDTLPEPTVEDSQAATAGAGDVDMSGREPDADDTAEEQDPDWMPSEEGCEEETPCEQDDCVEDAEDQGQEDAEDEEGDTQDEEDDEPEQLPAPKAKATAVLMAAAEAAAHVGAAAKSAAKAAPKAPPKAAPNAPPKALPNATPTAESKTVAKAASHATKAARPAVAPLSAVPPQRPVPTPEVAAAAAAPQAPTPKASAAAASGASAAAAAAHASAAPQAPTPNAKATLSIANASSTTHPKDWKKFTRLALNRRKFPQELVKEAKKDKTALFRVWLGEGKNIERVVVRMRREWTQRKEAEDGVQQYKKRELESMYGKEKAKQLVETRMRAKQYEVDPEFPNDPEEYWFWVQVAKKRRNVESVSNSVGMEHEGEMEGASASDLLTSALDMVVPEGAADNTLRDLLPTGAADNKKEKKEKKSDQKDKKDKKRKKGDDDDESDGADQKITPYDKAVAAMRRCQPYG